MSVASNPGHLLWSGIVPPERAGRVVHGCWSRHVEGWGIRTLSATHPAYNPYSYQNGSVWPHDNSLIALGFSRYGFAKEAARSPANQRQPPVFHAHTGCRNSMPASARARRISRSST